MTNDIDINLRIKLAKSNSYHLQYLEERELVIVDNKGLGMKTNKPLIIYSSKHVNADHLISTVPINPIVMTTIPKNPKVGTVYIDKNDMTLKRYNGSDWEIIGQLQYIEFDNNNGGYWKYYFLTTIETPPNEEIQYKIEFTENSINIWSNDLSQILVSGDIGPFWYESNRTDIRVFDENFEQNYFWIEKFDPENKHAIIWVKLKQGQQKLGIAFGNENCNESSYNNGDMTFEFFDDFEGDSLDTNKWNTNTNTYSVENGIIKMWGNWNGNNYYINTKQKFTSPVVVIGKWRCGQVNADTDLFVGFRTTETGVIWNDGYDCIYDSNKDEEYERKSIFKLDTEIVYGGVVADTNRHQFRIIFKSNEIRFWDDLLGELSASGHGLNEFYLGIGADTDSNDRYGYIDYIAIGKYIEQDLQFGQITLNEF